MTKMGDTAGVIDMGPHEGSFRTTKVYSASDKNTLFHAFKDKKYSEKSDPTSEDIKQHLPTNQDTQSHVALSKDTKLHTTKNKNTKEHSGHSADTATHTTNSNDTKQLIASSKETKSHTENTGNKKSNTNSSKYSNSYTSNNNDVISQITGSDSDPTRLDKEDSENERSQNLASDIMLQESKSATTQSRDNQGITYEASPHKQMKILSQKIQPDLVNSSKTEETSLSAMANSSHSVAYPDYSTYADYEEGLAAGGPSYYQDYQMGERLASMPYDFSGLEVDTRLETG